MRTLLRAMRRVDVTRRSVALRCDNDASPPMFRQVSSRSHRCDGIIDFPAGAPRVIVGGKIPGGNGEASMKMSAIAAAIAVAAGGGGAHAQGYPSHPITMIVPFPAGGPTDTLARVLGERMRVSLGQPVIIETVTGAAQAAPDGYTLSIGNWTSHVGAGAMYPAAHDAVLELQPVSRISATPLMIIGKNALAPKNARELIAWLKANPGKASAATVGA